jgi:hypothetical protein
MKPNDFSTLPPSIAQSLARLAGADPSSPGAASAKPEKPDQQARPGAQRASTK